jgi:predicted protein tyrosine phosphatase
VKNNILFVCSKNQCRSPTAEWLYGKNDDLSVSSAGTDSNSNNVASIDDLRWANQIFVFERSHRNKIRSIDRRFYDSLKIECLYIPDDYAYMDITLLYILCEKLTPYLGAPVRTISKPDA